MHHSVIYPIPIATTSIKILLTNLYFRVEEAVFLPLLRKPLWGNSYVYAHHQSDNQEIP